MASLLSLGPRRVQAAAARAAFPFVVAGRVCRHAEASVGVLWLRLLLSCFARPRQRMMDSSPSVALPLAHPSTTRLSHDTPTPNPTQRRHGFEDNAAPVPPPPRPRPPGRRRGQLQSEQKHQHRNMPSRSVRVSAPTPPHHPTPTHLSTTLLPHQILPWRSRTTKSV